MGIKIPSLDNCFGKERLGPLWRWDRVAITQNLLLHIRTQANKLWKTNIFRILEISQRLTTLWGALFKRGGRLKFGRKSSVGLYLALFYLPFPNPVGTLNSSSIPSTAAVQSSSHWRSQRGLECLKRPLSNNCHNVTWLSAIWNSPFPRTHLHLMDSEHLLVPGHLFKKKNLTVA